MFYQQPGHRKTLLLFILSVLLLSVTLSGCLNDRFDAIKKSPASFTGIIVQNLNKGVELKNVYVTPAKRYPGSFYVAGELFGKRMAGVVTGIWIIKGTNPPSELFSVSQAAIAFSRCTPSDTVPAMKAARLSSNNEARRLMTYIEGRHYR